MGSYYIWTVFALSYLPSAIEKPAHIPFAALVVLPIVLRALRRLESRTPSRA